MEQPEYRLKRYSSQRWILILVSEFYGLSVSVMMFFPVIILLFCLFYSEKGLSVYSSIFKPNIVIHLSTKPQGLILLKYICSCENYLFLCYAIFVSLINHYLNVRVYFKRWKLVDDVFRNLFGCF